MAGTLTRMAERAIGAKPVAMPLVRPIFAAPQKLVERDLEKPLMTASSGVTASTRDQVRVAPSSTPRNMDDRNNDPAEMYPNLESRVQRFDRMQEAERHASPEPFREAAPRRLTLKDAIDHIYGPREALGPRSALDPSVPERSSGPLPMPRRMQDESQEPAEINHERREPPALAEPRMERPRAAEPQRSRGFEDRSLRPVTLPLSQQAKIRVESGPAIPDVHVSIGRIELKAAPQPAPPAPSRASSRRPHLSLSDYLARRRGGRP
jgi:hypothetical protein